MNIKNELLKYFNGDSLAASVWQGKYAMEVEATPDDMHRRMAREFARMESKYQKEESQFTLNGSEADRSPYGLSRDNLTEESIYELLKDFKYVVPQGSVMFGLGRGIPVSLSNCFVIDSAKDSYGGIFLTDQEQAQLMKRRGGVGHDLSLLRPKGTVVHNSAKSSTGMASFMHRFSNTTREVAQDGRRGALMLSIDIKHPDSLDFIKIKRDGTSVTGANVSVKLGNDFLLAVENDEDYILRFPCNVETSLEEWTTIEYNKLITFSDHSGNVNYYVKRIKAREYWDELIYSAKNHAEPGLMYWDNVLSYDPAGVYKQYKPISSNPCGEQFLQPYDSCRLMALNLYSFVINPFTDKAEIDFDLLYRMSYEQQRLADSLVDLEIEYIDTILEKIKSDDEPYSVKEVEIDLWKKIQDTAIKGRRTGCGITALADMLAAIGVGYSSEEGLEITDKVMKIKKKAELDCNIDLAILRGSFDGFNAEKEDNKFYTDLKKNFPEQYEKMQQYGRRSVSWSTIAPTGSVSILTQTTSGCEPIFQPFYMRRKKINPNDGVSRVDFVDEIGDSWQEFPVLHEKFKDWMIGYIGLHGGYSVSDYTKEELQKLFEKSPWYGSTANDIDWHKRNEMQAVLQKYTTNAISSTINLPSTTTEQEVSDIYMSGWKLGLKGQTVYVDGSRSGVLVSSSDKSESNFEYRDAVKRPETVEADIHTSTTQGKKYNAIVGLVDGKPYEVFITDHFTNKTKLDLKKVKKGRYDLMENGETYSEDITTEMSESEEAITRLVSTSLRHGADIKFIVEQLQKTPSDNMFSFTKSLVRVLKKYIPDGATSTLSCDSCGGKNVIFEEGCNTCKDCGNSACS